MAIDIKVIPTLHGDEAVQAGAGPGRQDAFQGPAGGQLEAVGEHGHAQQEEADTTQQGGEQGQGGCGSGHGAANSVGSGWGGGGAQPEKGENRVSEQPLVGLFEGGFLVHFLMFE